MATTFGKITELVESQNGKVPALNEALGQIDKMLCGMLVKDISAGGTITVTETDSRYAVLVLTGTLPSNTTVNLDIDVSHPLVVVRDGSNASYTCTVQPASSGTTSDWESVRLEQGDVRYLFHSGVQAHDIGVFTAGNGNFYVRGGSVATGAYGSSQVIHREVVAVRARFRANMVGSRAILAAAATAQTDFAVAVNGVGVGTIRFAISGTVATFVGSFSSAWDVVPGDIITVTAPASADATASGLAFTLKGHLR